MKPDQRSRKHTEEIVSAIERAMQEFEKLEAALDAGNHRMIGTALSDCRRALKEAKQIVHDRRSEK